MNHEALAQDLLAAYGQLAGLPGLQFDSNGCARLVFDESVVIDLEIDRDAACIQVYGVLGPVPPGGREALYRRLLEGNLFGSQTSGAALAIDPDREEVLLCRRVDVATATATDVAPLLESFAGFVDHWQQKLGSGELVAGNGAGDSAAPPRLGLYMRA